MEIVTTEISIFDILHRQKSVFDITSLRHQFIMALKKGVDSETTTQLPFTTNFYCLSKRK